MNKKTLSFIILTKNEEKHIARCINSVKEIADDILVVDSFSSDNTIKIAESLGARVIQHPFKNHSFQVNFGIRECGIKSDWIWRLDADEYIEGGLGEKIKEYIQEAPEEINGLYVRKRIDFMGRPLLHGGWYPVYHLKVWKRGHAICETKWMDEHIKLLDGHAISIDKGCQVDANLNSLTWWTEKHNGYSSREVADMLITEYDLDYGDNNVEPDIFGTDEQRKRWLKKKYVKSPLFLRPLINFVLRYFLKAGFLDGKEGFIWHILQGFWYRMLVDAKLFELKKELKRKCKVNNTSMKDEVIKYINTNFPR